VYVLRLELIGSAEMSFEESFDEKMAMMRSMAPKSVEDEVFEIESRMKWSGDGVEGERC
jgi:hypothetical protein